MIKSYMPDSFYFLLLLMLEDHRSLLVQLLRFGLELFFALGFWGI